MASSGIGSIPHLAIEQMADATGAKLLHVPYKGAAPAITDLMGGQVGGFFGDVPGLLGHVQGGKLKALGIASSQAASVAARRQDAGGAGHQGRRHQQLVRALRAGEDAARDHRGLNKAVRKTLGKPAVRDKLLKSGAEPAPSTPQELAALLKQDTEKWAKLIRAKNIKAE